MLIAINAMSQTYNERIAATVMTIWKDSLSMDGKPAKWTYDQGVILKGIESLWYATGEGKYFDYLQKSMDFFVNDKGEIRGYKQDEYNIDNVLCGRNLLTLYAVTGKEKYYKAATILREQLKNQPRTKEGGFWHKKRYPYQMWLDGLYMGEPFYAEYAKTFHDTAAFNDIANQFIWMEKHARDAKTGLLYHAWDESKKQHWANKETGCSPNFWARAMGWYGMALVDVLQVFPENHPKRKLLLDILQRYIVAVEKYQDKSTGLWWDIADKPNESKNYLEASASCMFVYTIAKAVRLNYIKQENISFAVKGYTGIIQKFIQVKNGMTVLNGTVSVSGLGGEPYRDGSYDYYMSEKVVTNDPKGIGAFLLMSNEMEMQETISIGKGKTVLLDDYYNSERKKDITGIEMPFHYKWEEMPNSGFSYLANVFHKFGLHTKTLSDQPDVSNLAKADIFIIVDADNLSDNPHPNYVGTKDANAIYDWVKAGGVLVLMHNDKGNAEFEHFNTLAEKFGIHFNEDSRNRVIGNQFATGTFNLTSSNEIFKTAKKIYLKEICTLKLSASATSVLNDTGDVIMAVSKIGRGVVFAVGDPWLYNEYVDGRKLPVEFENNKAANDLVLWLIKQIKNKH